jgi:hypothetical protein
VSKNHPIGWLIFFSLVVVSCVTNSEKVTPYIAPSLAAPPGLRTTLTLNPLDNSQEVTDLKDEFRLTPTPACRTGLTFLEDITIPDGTIVAPGTHLDKRWLAENSGSCNWDQSYRIKIIAGPNLGASDQQALYPARSGTQAVIQIDFIAPSEPGSYRSAWQAFSPLGESFGDPFFIEIVVEAP